MKIKKYIYHRLGFKLVKSYVTKIKQRVKYFIELHQI